MKNNKVKEPPWETPSLTWIHQVRQEIQADEGDEPIKPVSTERAEKLAKRLRLRLARPAVEMAPSEHTGQ
ncbi:MAG: hypothetical protein NPIRA02_02230 [Nitrospirales bacterium]|nr:MAG: hypothetical protein NPIRA02_02230 [Nitrospirales bacterium]